MDRRQVFIIVLAVGASGLLSRVLLGRHGSFALGLLIALAVGLAARLVLTRSR